MKLFASRLFGVLLIISFNSQASAEAATLYIDPGMATLYRGDALTSSIRLMPDQANGECVNAADIVVTYPESIIPTDVSIGRSIFSVWVEAPVIDKENRRITLAGGIPNGYCGRVQGDPRLTNVIADIIFRSPGLVIGAKADNSGEARLEFTEETNVYLNDGMGTKAPLRTLPSIIKLDPNPGSELTDEWRNVVQNDSLPPEEFSVTLERDPLAFNGRYFIVFSTADKQSGISHYEVIEDPLHDSLQYRWGRADAPWIRVPSPYVLRDQSLNSTIRVKAVDKAGNEYIATLIPNESLRVMPVTVYYFYVMIAGGSLLILLLLILGFWLLRKKRRSDSVNEVSDLDKPEN